MWKHLQGFSTRKRPKACIKYQYWATLLILFYIDVKIIRCHWDIFSIWRKVAWQQRLTNPGSQFYFYLYVQLLIAWWGECGYLGVSNIASICSQLSQLGLSWWCEDILQILCFKSSRLPSWLIMGRENRPKPSRHPLSALIISVTRAWDMGLAMFCTQLRATGYLGSWGGDNWREKWAKVSGF